MSTDQGDLIGFKPSELAATIKTKCPSSKEPRYKTGMDRQQLDLIGYDVEDFVDTNNPVRAINAYVDSLDLKKLGFTNTLAESNSGQPAYSPSMLLKLYLYGYQNRIRSTRRLARECKRNVEVMWLLEKLSPEYRTIGSFRADNAKGIRAAHKQFIQLCKYIGLLSENRVSVDGSHFKGNVSAKSFRTKKSLDKRNEKIDREIGEWNQLVEQTDEREGRKKSEAKNDAALVEMLESIQKLKTEKERNQYLLQLLEETGQKHVSCTDIDAQLMSKHGKSGQGYNVQIAVDSKSGLIAADDVMNRANDREELYNMASLAQKALGVYKLDVLADQGYSSGKQFKQCYDNGIRPYVPIMTPRSLMGGEQRYKTAEFTFDKEHNVYVCPMGEQLHPSGKPREDGGQMYRSRKALCEQCDKRKQCLTKKGSIREINRSEHEELMAAHKKHMEQHPEAMRERSSTVEHPFGTIKVRAGWTHFLVRGQEKVMGEWSLMALGYNLTRVLNLIGMDKFIEYCRESQAQRC